MQNCIYLKQKLNHSLECKKKQKIINIKECSNCKFKEFKKMHKKSDLLCKNACNGIKYHNKSSKIAKLERNRFSVFTEDLDHCILCGDKKDNLHEIFFGKNRIKSMNYGFVIPLCFNCHLEMHRNTQLQEIWHIRGQLYFEKHLGSRNEFIKVFGKSHIKKEG